MRSAKPQEPNISSRVKACQDPVKRKYLKIAAKGYSRSVDNEDWNFVARRAYYMWLREYKGVGQADAERISKIDSNAKSTFGNCTDSALRSSPRRRPAKRTRSRSRN